MLNSKCLSVVNNNDFFLSKVKIAILLDSESFGHFLQIGSNGFDLSFGKLSLEFFQVEFIEILN
jgi:hypothetical protein